MKKEHFKNIVLIALIITNFMLSQRIFANKKLWLFGYNFFANTENSLNNDDYLTTLHITYPEKIYVNTGYQSSRFIYSRGSEKFGEIFSNIEPLIHSAFSVQSKTATEITKDEWFSVLSGKSLYLSFGGEYSAQVYSELLGISETGIVAEAISHIAVSDSGNVYIADNARDTYFRVLTTGSQVKTIIEEIMADNTDTESIINYSYELNFDKAFGDQKTFISPMVPVYSTPIYKSELICENPIMRGDELNQNVINKILAVFSINQNTVRRYTEADGTFVFVENNGVLRISPAGIVTFTANDTGINLSDGGYPVIAIARFIDSINMAAGGRKDMTVTSGLTQGSGNFTFDYMINELSVKFMNMPAVTASVKDGYLKEYTHILRSYYPTQQQNPVPMFIEALDETILTYQDYKNSIHITQMYPAYKDNLSSAQILPDWQIEINTVIAE